MSNKSCLEMSRIAFVLVLTVPPVCGCSPTHADQSTIPVVGKSNAAQQRDNTGAIRPEQLVQLAQLLEYEDGERRDMTKAIELYERASQLGNPQAKAILANLYSIGDRGAKKDIALANRLAEDAANSGNALANYLLASNYQKGLGLDLDECMADHHFRLAFDSLRLLAEAGDAWSQFSLGVMYKYGYGGIDADEEKAVELFQLAAAQDFPRGQHGLALMLEAGRGELTVDKVAATELFQLAADAGYAPAQYKIADRYYRGSAGLTHDYEQALTWYRASASQEYAPAQNNLGLMHLNGRGTPTNGVEAQRLFSLAAAQGDRVAQFNLGYNYLTGRGGCTIDHSMAFEWMLKSAKKDYPHAQEYVGKMFVDGTGVVADPQKALHYLERAAEQEEPGALTYLGVCYDKGLLGLTRDRAKAKSLIVLAAAKSDHSAMNYLFDLVFDDVVASREYLLICEDYEESKWTAAGILSSVYTSREYQQQEFDETEYQLRLAAWQKTLRLMVKHPLSSYVDLDRYAHEQLNVPNLLPTPRRH